MTGPSLDMILVALVIVLGQLVAVLDRGLPH
jgi:hypothetical protein